MCVAYDVRHQDGAGIPGDLANLFRVTVHHLLFGCLVQVCSSIIVHFFIFLFFCRQVDLPSSLKMSRPRIQLAGKGADLPLPIVQPSEGTEVVVIAGEVRDQVLLF